MITSFKEWQNRRLLEFVGPQGQPDPQGQYGVPPAKKYGGSPEQGRQWAGQQNAYPQQDEQQPDPNVVDPSAQSGSEEQQPQKKSLLPQSIVHYLNKIGRYPPKTQMAIRQEIYQRVQTSLASRGEGAERTGARMGLNAAYDMKKQAYLPGQQTGQTPVQ